MLYSQEFGTGLDCDDIPQWAPGEPNNGAGGGQDCGQLYKGGQIDDAGCGNLKPFICEFENLAPKLVASASDVIYIGQTEKVAYATAKANCASFGGQLATFSNAAQFDLLTAVVNAMGGRIWFGFDDSQVENHWNFVDGDLSYWYVFHLCNAMSNICLVSQPFGTGLDCDDIPQWAPGEPNNGAGRGQHCGQLYSGGQIDDTGCGTLKPYICEFDVNVFEVSTGIPAVDQGNPAGSPDCQCLYECEGDCDGDGDCIGDLLCYHRNAWDDGLPAGCTGSPHWESHDYCFDPEKSLAPGPGSTYFVFEVTGFQGTGGLLLAATMFMCVACLAYLAIKNYQGAHGRSKGYGKVVMESEPEM